MGGEGGEISLLTYRCVGCNVKKVLVFQDVVHFSINISVRAPHPF